MIHFSLPYLLSETYCLLQESATLLVEILCISYSWQTINNSEKEKSCLNIIIPFILDRQLFKDKANYCFHRKMPFCWPCFLKSFVQPCTTGFTFTWLPNVCTSNIGEVLPRDLWRGGAAGPGASWLYWGETGSGGCYIVCCEKLWKEQEIFVNK